MLGQKKKKKKKKSPPNTDARAHTTSIQRESHKKEVIEGRFFLFYFGKKRDVKYKRDLLWNII